MDDFSKYQALKDDGKSVSEVCTIAKTSGLDQITVIRMLRQVFGLSLAEAKAVWFEVHTARSLCDYQGELAKQLPEILNSFDRDLSKRE